MKTILQKAATLTGAAACVLAVSPAYAQDATNGSDSYGERLGTVVLPTGCTDQAHDLARIGLALLHHMTYEGARAVFADAREADPECAIAYWGGAMTYIHPMWSDPPSEEHFAAGASLTRDGLAINDLDTVEAAYLSTVSAYYKEGRGSAEAPNLRAFAEAWTRVHKEFLDDPEAALFHAITQVSVADPTDLSYERQRYASDVASVVLEQIPDHPGAHHYYIHANDYPDLAERAIDVARSYAEIAPAVPHALHMPAHILTRLGYWDDSVELNSRSSAAALRHPSGERVSPHYHHAVDYLVYAFLQQGNDEAAHEWVQTFGTLGGPHVPHPAIAYAFAAVPARYALERQQWEAAAALTPRTPASYPWDQFPAMEAIARYAKGIGAARSGRVDVAAAEIEQLAALRDRTADTAPYWSRQIEIQRMSVDAWLTHARGDRGAALEKMRAAAALEATTDKHPVTPGEVIPAGELLGDMLLGADLFDEAQQAYAAALERNPNRLNCLYGAGRAAQLAGDEDAATGYFLDLLSIAEAFSPRERVAYAREAVLGS